MMSHDLFSSANSLFAPLNKLARELCYKNLKSMVIPVGPKSDQHQFSPNKISRSSKKKVMRITQLLRENALILNQILLTNLKRNVWGSVWRICM